jgi:hypothetical protein
MAARTAALRPAPRAALARWTRSSAVRDTLFLAAITALSAVPYLTRLGFYSDDWSFLGVLVTTEDQSLPGLIRGQFEADPGGLGMRPTQVFLQATLYRLFGLEPLGYHLVNLAVLIGVAAALSLVLRQIRMPRILAVAIPAVYAVMPNHATNRFWFASFGYLLGMALYLGGLSADLRAASSDRRGRVWRWKLLALVPLSFAALGYEVILPLFLLNIVLAEVTARRLGSGGFRSVLGRPGIVVFHGSTLLVAGVAVAYKASVALGAGIPGSPVRHVLRLAAIALVPNLGTYGVALPHTVGWSIPRAGLWVVLLAAGIGVGVYGYLGIVRGSGHREQTGLSRRFWVWLGAAGIVVLALGYAIFLTTARIAFSSTGIANRVHAAGALGASIALVAALGWAASWLRTAVARDRLFRGAVGALCASGVIVIGALGSFWVQSWQTQRDVLSDVHATFPTLPSGAAVLLAGVCPYVGPAPVFESSWDLRGALQVRHRDPSLDGDVTSGNVWAAPDGVVTRIYAVEVVHPYDDQLFLYDRRDGTRAALPDRAVAERLLPAATDDDCPEGTPGVGTIALPLDALVHRVEGRLRW